MIVSLWAKNYDIIRLILTKYSVSYLYGIGTTMCGIYDPKPQDYEFNINANTVKNQVISKTAS